MTNRISCAWDLPDALVAINAEVMDSAFENCAVRFVQEQPRDIGWDFLSALLTHHKANARILGLRVVRRQIRDKDILERVVQLCFCVERFSELQHWYKAILVRYPTLKFSSRLSAEILSRADKGFTERHIRALQMYDARGSKVKGLALARLLEVSAMVKSV